MSLKKFFHREIPIARLLGKEHFYNSFIRILNIKTHHEWVDIDKRHHRLVRKWMDYNFIHFADSKIRYLKEKKSQIYDYKCLKIWQLWYQRAEKAPDLIKNCMKSVEFWLEQEHVNRTILDDESLDQLQDFPQDLLKKYHDGIISRQCFSDIVRFFVLSMYGGVWIDSTIMQTAPLEDHIFESEFFSLKMPFNRKLKQYVPHGKWSAFFLASKPKSLLMEMAFSIMCEYWRRFDTLVDYYLVDYIIDFLYRVQGTDRQTSLYRT